MGTMIERLDFVRGGWRDRHSALHLAVSAAKTCLKQAGRDPHDVDLLVNAGIYRDKNLGEPALAALIQKDIGANPEDPHEDAHGTFSFDIANGACGILTALQVVDGFLRSRAIDRALVVASDADPGSGMSEHFPFSPVGAALLCGWTAGDCGLDRVHWSNDFDHHDNFTATVGFDDRRNVLRFSESSVLDKELATAGADIARRCLDAHSLELADIDVIVAAPPRHGYRAALAAQLGVQVDDISVADDEQTHTTAFAAAFSRAVGRTRLDARLLLISAGAGVTAGAALYRLPARVTSRDDSPL